MDQKVKLTPKEVAEKRTQIMEWHFGKGSFSHNLIGNALGVMAKTNKSEADAIYIELQSLGY